MKGPVRYVPWVLPLLLTGCFHKARQARIQPLAPPLVITSPPAPPPETATAKPSAKPSTTATVKQAPAPVLIPQPEPAHKVQERRPRPVRRPVQQAANGAANGVSAIGQLSTGDPPDLLLQTEKSIASTEHGLKSIKGKLNTQQQQTVEHIQVFLKQARKALNAGDVDGASTLAAKAKVLLAEILQ